MGLQITAIATGKDAGEILVYGDISDEKWWEEDVTPSDFDKKLKDLGDIKELTVRINSYGGSVFAGQAIVAMLDRKRLSGCRITTLVDGIAASMASVIAQAGDPVVMAEGAMMMVHKPSGCQWGNADDLRKYADMLDKAENLLVSVYMRNYNGTEEELRAMLRRETWLTADEALECGLCAKIDAPVSVAACAGGYRFGGLSVPVSEIKEAERKIRLTKSGGGEKKMFDDITQEKIRAVLNAGKCAVISRAEKGFTVAEALEETAVTATADVYLTSEQVEAAAGKAVDANGVLKSVRALAAAGIDLNAVEDGLAKLRAPAQDNETVAKAAKYDQIRAAAVDDALKNAVRAKGERYNEARERKMLEALTYEEIVAQSADWLEDCKAQLHAGRRISAPGAAASVDKKIDLNDFKI